MPTQSGKCTNFGNCDVANRSEVVAIPPGAEFKCPKCLQPLRPIGQSEASGRRALLLFGAVALVALIAVSAWFAFLHNPSATNRDATTADNASPPPGRNAGEPPHANVILRLHGSNTIGAELAPALAEAWLRHRGASIVGYRADKQPEQGVVVGVLPGQSQPAAVEIYGKGSTTAFTDLIAGATDIGMSSRRIKPDEKNQLAPLGDLEAYGAENVIGLDGVAVIVHKSNPVKGLTREQVRKIFSGETANWKDLGGAPAEIHVYARPPASSGTFETFNNLVLVPAKLTSSAKFIDDSIQLSDAVAQDTGGIGFIGLPYVRSASAIGIGDQGTRPLLPNAFTVGREDYLLSRRLYLYLPPKRSKPDAQSFVEFALSDEGQKVVEKIGFVAQSVKVDPARTRPDGASALNFSFRFRTGSAELDNKAVEDLKRVVDYAKTAGTQGLLLMGYTDNVGASASNVALSRKRADAVADELRSRGLNVAGTGGLGAESPVASNGTPEGREQNRRVEIWTKK